MSTPVVCDYCKAEGKITRYRMAPEGWLYLCAFDSEITDPAEASEFVIMLACSQACASALWRPGPGPQLEAFEADRRLELERAKASEDGYFSSWSELPESRQREINAQLLRKAALDEAKQAAINLSIAALNLRDRLRQQGLEPTPQQAERLAQLDEWQGKLSLMAIALEKFL